MLPWDSDKPDQTHQDIETFRHLLETLQINKMSRKVLNVMSVLMCFNELIKQKGHEFLTLYNDFDLK